MVLRPGIIVQTIDESKRVLDAMERKEARVLVRTGSFGRKTLRNTIDRVKGISAPGSPPHAHVKGSAGLKDVRYQVSKVVDQFVIIGHEAHTPKRSRPSKRGTTRKFISSKPVPQLLNEGGAAAVEVNTTRSTRVYPANYRMRPFRDKVFNVTLRFLQERIAEEGF